MLTLEQEFMMPQTNQSAKLNFVVTNTLIVRDIQQSVAGRAGGQTGQPAREETYPTFLTTVWPDKRKSLAARCAYRPASPKKQARMYSRWRRHYDGIRNQQLWFTDASLSRPRRGRQHRLL